MRFSDIVSGVLVQIKDNGNYVSATVKSKNKDNVIIEYQDNVLERSVYTMGLDWNILPEKSFIKIGSIKQGSIILLGRKAGKSFIPGAITLFCDGFKIDDKGKELIIAKNLNIPLHKELLIENYGITWSLADI